MSKIDDGGPAYAAMYAALKRQRLNIEKWLDTGVSAGSEESKSIYDQICAALDVAEGGRDAAR
jgi:hypothetical protein